MTSRSLVRRLAGCAAPNFSLNIWPSITECNTLVSVMAEEEQISWRPPRPFQTTSTGPYYTTTDWIEIAAVRYILISIHVFAIVASALGNGVLIYLILRNKKFRRHITAYLVSGSICGLSSSIPDTGTLTFFTLVKV